MLAVVIFDKDGRLMVTREGALPTRLITNFSHEQVPLLANSLMLIDKLTLP
jgi:hypothetical protein